MPPGTLLRATAGSNVLNTSYATHRPCSVLLRCVCRPVRAAQAEPGAGSPDLGPALPVLDCDHGQPRPTSPSLCSRGMKRLHPLQRLVLRIQVDNAREALRFVRGTWRAQWRPQKRQDPRGRDTLRAALQPVSWVFGACFPPDRLRLSWENGHYEGTEALLPGFLRLLPGRPLSPPSQP